MEIETKFITLDDRESSYAKVAMPRTVVFYPYFHFKASNEEIKGYGKGIGEGCCAYKITLEYPEFDIAKVEKFEKAFNGDRREEYGFWTVRKGGEYFIGLGAQALLRMLDTVYSAHASHVMLSKDDRVLVFEIEKGQDGRTSARLDIYLSNVNKPYSESAAEIALMLKESGLKEHDGALKGSVCNYSFMKYKYYADPKIRAKACRTVTTAPSHQKKKFMEHVHGCTWHTIVVEDDVINQGPHYVLLKNSGIRLGNVLDDLDYWLVHRRGGFVMGEEFASNDFHQDTTFTIREIDEYVMGDLIILNVECDTFSKNRDEGLEDFLKSISEKRFI